MPIRKSKKVASAVEEGDIVAMITEVNTIQGKVQGWWYDTAATVHVCYDRSTLKTYEELTDGQEVQMGNEVQSKVVGKGIVELIFTSGNKVIMTNVLHVLDMRRNLVSGDFLG